MLRAILKGKAAKVSIDGHDVSWREVFRRREDLLTAAIFGRFPYLSEGAKAVLIGKLLAPDVQDSLGEFLDIELWPRFSRGNGEGVVEPDVVAYFSEMLLIIEVKPPEGGWQHAQQWRQELEVLLRERENPDSYREIPDRIVLLALGRNPLDANAIGNELVRSMGVNGLRFVAREWEEFLRCTSELLESEDRSDQDTNATDSAILGDLVDAMDLYGISPPRRPFSDLFREDLRMDSGAISTMCSWDPSARKAIRRSSDWIRLVNFYQCNPMD